MISFHKKRKNGGISLIEMIVAIGLFTVVTLIALTALIAINNSNKKTKVTREIVDSITFALEDIVRTTRLGQNYHCYNDSSFQYNHNLPSGFDEPKSCELSLNQGGNYLIFEGINGDLNDPGDQIAYRFVNIGSGSNAVKVIEKSAQGGASGSWVQLTDPNSKAVSIENLRFYVDGSDPEDQAQARVLIILKAVAGKGTKNETLFNLQTTVGQRSSDCCKPIEN